MEDKTEKQYIGWLDCSKKASDVLSKGLDKENVPFIRIWHYPQFEKQTSWFLYENHEKPGNYIISIITWDRMADEDKLLAKRQAGNTEIFFANSKDPSIQEMKYEISGEIIDTWLEKFYSLRIQPFVKKRLLGPEGESWGIDFDNFQLMKIKMTFEWWCTAPLQWIELENWVHGFTNFLKYYKQEK